MSYEPVAKRTRLSVSRSQTEGTRGAEEVQKELGVLNEQYENMRSKCEEVVQLALNMNQTVDTIKKLVPKDGTTLCLRDMERSVEQFKFLIRSSQTDLRTIKQFIEYISTENLHDFDCSGSDECVLEMEKVLVRDPLSLECKRQIGPMYSHLKRSPLHDAVSKGHVKCVKFLLEKGADVTSLTTCEDSTIMHTLYKSSMSNWERLGILELLLNYGMSCMFSHKDAGKFAIMNATLQFAVDEMSLLLQHGATLTELQTQSAILEAWENYELPLLKVFFLYSPYQFYLGPSDICQELAHFCYKKMILPGVPLDLCHEKYLEALKFYKAFGGKFCVSRFPWVDLDQDLLQFFNCYEHRRHFKGVRKRIEALISNPLSLKEISRLVVRKHIPTDYVESIKKLEVPQDLQPILRFDDVIITDVPDKFDKHDAMDSSTDNEDTEDDEEVAEDSDIDLWL